MSRYTDLEQMLVIVAKALGSELLQQVVFVGGCTTGLLITDKAKLEAYIGRGNQDPLASHDIEDLLNVVDGHEALQQELEQAEANLKTYVRQQINLLLKHRDIEYAVQATARNNPERELVIFRRLEALAALNI